MKKHYPLMTMRFIPAWAAQIGTNRKPGGLILSTIAGRCILLLCCLLLLGTPWARAQCDAPVAVTTSTTASACLATGSITIDTVTGGSGTYEYALYNAANTIQIIPWQSSPVMSNLSAGIYTLRVHSVCSNPVFSTELTKSVTVAGNYQQPVLTVTVNRPSQCNNGRISGSTEGNSGPYFYALVPALNTPEPVSIYIRPQQSGNIFDSLAAGTYYMRKYDACGSTVTQAIVVPAYTQNSSFNSWLTYHPCDSFTYSFSHNPIADFGTSLPGTADTLRRFWVVHPDGTTDTVSQSLAPVPTRKFHISKLGTLGSGNFPGNIGGTWPKPYQLGFKDACGSIFTFNGSIAQPTITWTTSMVGGGSCTTADYRTTGSISSSGANGFEALKLDEVTMTIDSGTSFVVPIQSIANVAPADTTFTLTRNASHNVCITYCSQTFCSTVSAPALPAWTFNIFEDAYYSCEGNSGIGFASGSSTVFPVTVQMLSAPPGQPLIDTFSIANTTAAFFTNPPYTGYRAGNLLPGAYTLRYTDACGRIQDKTITLSHPKEPLTVSYLYPCSGNTITIKVKARYWSGISGSSFYDTTFNTELSAIILNPDNTPASAVMDVFDPSTNSVSLPVAQFNALTNGNTYKIWVYSKYANGPADRDYLTSCWFKDVNFVKTTNGIDLSNSIAVACPPGTTGTIAAVAQGGGGYNYSLYQNSVNPANLLAGPQTGNIFNNLNSGINYVISVFDSCGRSTQRTMSFGSTSSLPIFYSNTNTPCIADNFTFSTADIPNASYQWYKDNVSLPGATTNNYALSNIQQSDSGTYKVDVTLGNCQVSAVTFNLNPAICGTPLPISLLYFTAKRQKEQVLLQWATTSEYNNSGFSVERSTDGKTWANITFEISKGTNGNSNTLLQYNYNDKTPVEGNNFYRLKQTDLDGNYKYSIIRQVTFSQNTISIYPNPAGNYIIIDGLNSGESIKIYDAVGRIVKEIKPAQASVTIGLEGLDDGLYHIQIAGSNGTVISRKIVKMN